MGGLVVIAGRLHRDTHVYVSLALTGAIMLGLKPGLASDVSFLLSFAGTAGIATFTDPIAGRLGFLPGLLRDPFAATVAAEVATWPLMLANFHKALAGGAGCQRAPFTTAAGDDDGRRRRGASWPAYPGGRLACASNRRRGCRLV